MMDAEVALRLCDALSGDLRMRALMLLSKAGADGIASGLLARRLKVPANSLSTQLGLLELWALSLNTVTAGASSTAPICPCSKAWFSSSLLSAGPGV